MKNVKSEAKFSLVYGAIRKINKNSEIMKKKDHWLIFHISTWDSDGLHSTIYTEQQIE